MHMYIGYKIGNIDFGAGWESETDIQTGVAT